MKRILIIFCLAIFSFSFTSCGDDDTVDDTNLIGTWKLTAINTQQAYDINYNGTSNTNLIEELNEINAVTDINCMANETMTFNANNTVLISSSSDFDFEVYIYDGQASFDIDCDAYSDSETISWSQNGNVVSMDLSEENSTVSIDGNELSFVVSEFLYIYNNDTGEETYEDVTVVYTKQ